MIKTPISPTRQLLQISQQRLDRVLQINRELSATLDLQELLQSIAKAAAELTDSSQGAIARYDASENCLRFITAPWMSAEQMQSLKVPLVGSIMGQAFQHMAPVITDNVKNLGTHFQEVDRTTGFETQSMLAVPLSTQGTATGVLSAVNKRDGTFSHEDIYLMESLASQAAIAIQNAQLLRESQEAYTALAELEEMRSNFIAITSHELRIPLGLILGHATFLKELLEGEALQQTLVIERAAMRLKDIVEDLSKIDNIEQDRAMLRAVAYDAAAQMRKILTGHESAAEKRGVVLTSRLPNEPLHIQADGEKLRVAVDHLVKNAIDFTDKGGKVELSLKDEGNAISIQVADTGVGISSKDLHRIFDRFYQTEDHMTRKHGGMGLGLTVAKLMVEMHAGEIGVESVQGKGSRFTIRIPKTVTKSLEIS
jgi:signal transduction histidine kinase